MTLIRPLSHNQGKMYFQSTFRRGKRCTNCNHSMRKNRRIAWQKLPISIKPHPIKSAWPDQGPLCTVIKALSKILLIVTLDNNRTAYKHFPLMVVANQITGHRSIGPAVNLNSSQRRFRDGFRCRPRRRVLVILRKFVKQTYICCAYCIETCYTNRLTNNDKTLRVFASLFSILQYRREKWAAGGAKMPVLFSSFSLSFIFWDNYVVIVTGNWPGRFSPISDLIEAKSMMDQFPTHPPLEYRHLLSLLITQCSK